MYKRSGIRSVGFFQLRLPCRITYTKSKIKTNWCFSKLQHMKIDSYATSPPSASTGTQFCTHYCGTVIVPENYVWNYPCADWKTGPKMLIIQAQMPIKVGGVPQHRYPSCNISPALQMSHSVKQNTDVEFVYMLLLSICCTDTPLILAYSQQRFLVS